MTRVQGRTAGEDRRPRDQQGAVAVERRGPDRALEPDRDHVAAGVHPHDLAVRREDGVERGARGDPRPEQHQRRLAVALRQRRYRRGEDGERLRGPAKTQAKKRAVSGRALIDLERWIAGDAIPAAAE